MVARDVDEELTLFLEMRRREKAKGVSSLPEPGRTEEVLTRLPQKCFESAGKSVPTAAKSTSLTIREIPARPVSTSRGRTYSYGGSSAYNDVNPVLMGTQMVERVVNMRKLPPPKQDDSISSSFGRTLSLSRSSLDMALRHMNIKYRSSGNLRVTSNAPTNSMERTSQLLDDHDIYYAFQLMKFLLTLLHATLLL
ncbi:hypothetical protein Bca4012_029127 [Brassica carinata]